MLSSNLGTNIVHKLKVNFSPGRNEIFYANVCFGNLYVAPNNDNSCCCVRITFGINSTEEAIIGAVLDGNLHMDSYTSSKY